MTSISLTYTDSERREWIPKSRAQEIADARDKLQAQLTAAQAERDLEREMRESETEIVNRLSEQNAKLRDELAVLKAQSNVYVEVEKCKLCNKPSLLADLLAAVDKWCPVEVVKQAAARLKQEMGILSPAAEKAAAIGRQQYADGKMVDFDPLRELGG